MAQPIKNLIVDSLRARVYATQDQLVQEAAREVQSYLQQVLMAQGRAAAIFATGNSQIQFLRQLVNLGGADWSKITLFHMDEYLGISADHPASFRRYMRERVASLTSRSSLLRSACSSSRRSTPPPATVGMTRRGFAAISVVTSFVTAFGSAKVRAMQLWSRDSTPLGV